jgi:hypothetical protein
MTLRGLPLVLQAALGDGLAFDPFSLQQDCLTVSEVDVGRGYVRCPASEKLETGACARRYSIKAKISRWRLFRLASVVTSAPAPERSRSARSKFAQA